MKKNLIVFHCETTGLNNPEVLKAYAFLMYKKDGQTYSKKYNDVLFNTRTPIEAGASDYHKITQDMVKDKDYFNQSQLFNDMRELIKTGNTNIILYSPFFADTLQNSGLDLVYWDDKELNVSYKTNIMFIESIAKILSDEIYSTYNMDTIGEILKEGSSYNISKYINPTTLEEKARFLYAGILAINENKDWKDKISKISGKKSISNIDDLIDLCGSKKLLYYPSPKIYYGKYKGANMNDISDVDYLFNRLGQINFATSSNYIQGLKNALVKAKNKKDNSNKDFCEVFYDVYMQTSDYKINGMANNNPLFRSMIKDVFAKVDKQVNTQPLSQRLDDGLSNGTREVFSF